MFLAVSIDKDLGSDMSIPVPWADEWRRIIMKGEGTIQVIEYLKTANKASCNFSTTWRQYARVDCAWCVHRHLWKGWLESCLSTFRKLLCILVLLRDLLRGGSLLRSLFVLLSVQLPPKESRETVHSPFKEFTRRFCYVPFPPALSSDHFFAFCPLRNACCEIPIWKGPTESCRVDEFACFVSSEWERYDGCWFKLTLLLWVANLRIWRREHWREKPVRYRLLVHGKDDRSKALGMLMTMFE